MNVDQEKQNFINLQDTCNDAMRELHIALGKFRRPLADIKRIQPGSKDDINELENKILEAESICAKILNDFIIEPYYPRPMD